ncbi:peptide/nickel transport system substrate-binding protein [Bosea sp. AK1]|uniref:ABC transporter substrate-binding protein n=1 Tax=Bosea sp. AK1 TaxID=2587160 RepID=UPI000DE1BD2E|nr:ABC transporter substrate-binding protein [Bosea sp. AK1]TQI75814.1 peptide/nickel transport system substrate-binding protein [Bosea sp. AK1]
MPLFRPTYWSGFILSAGLALASMAGAAAAQTLTIAQGNDILSLDPANHGNNSTESALVNIYEYLVDKDFSQGQLRFTPRLARSWSTEDNIRWTFKLRDDVLWHNGDRFTAADVKFTIERAQQDKKLINASKFRRIKSVEAPDDTTVVIETDRPDTLLLHYFVGNGAGILPKAAFEKAGGKEEFFKKPVGTGPYVFEQWIKSDQVILSRNPRWWGGTPKWEKVVIRSIPETTTRVAELLTGGVDIAVNIPPEDIARLNDNKGTRAITFDIARNIALHVRTGKDRVTGDPKLREAIDLAIDRDAIVKQVLEGHGKSTRGFFPPAIPGFAPDLNTNIRFDPERAKALLKEAGFDGRKRPAIKISTPSGRYVKDREIVEAVGGYLEDVGFRVQVEVLDWTVYNSRLAGDGFGELYLWGMGSYTDASSIFVQDFKRHYDWSDPAFEDLAKKAGNAKTEAERIALSQQAQKIVAEQRVRIGLLLPQSIYGVSDRVVYDGRFDEMIAAEDVGRP